MQLFIFIIKLVESIRLLDAIFKKRNTKYLEENISVLAEGKYYTFLGRGLVFSYAEHMLFSSLLLFYLLKQKIPPVNRNRYPDLSEDMIHGLYI
jgi:hypothetical protein